MKQTTTKQINKASRKGNKSRKGKGPAKGPHVPSLSLGADTLLGLAQSQRRTLAFAGTTSVTSTTGAYSEVVIPMIDAFNTFGGASAIGYAKYMAFYQRAFVLGSRVIIKGVVVQGAGGATVVGVAASSVASSFATTAAAIEAGLCQWVVVGTYPDRLEFTQSVETRKFLNVPDPLTSTRLYSTSAASPSDIIDLHVFIDAAGSVTATFQFTFEVLLDVTFTDPIPFT
jgi:hypothetical protein